MRFSIGLAYSPPEHYVPIAKAADEAGYHAIAVSDHVINLEELKTPYPYTPDGSRRWEPFTPWRDPWVSIGAMAAATERLNFFTNVYVLPMRNVFHVAKAVGTAAAISGNRVALGIGMGWCEEEFDLMEQPFRKRGARADEQLEVMRKVWTGEMVEHHGDFYDFPKLEMNPPVTAPVPVYVGGATAMFIDMSERIEQRLPWFIGAVILLSVLLLMVVFRSIAVPVKAAVMNLLSIGAAYGVIVAVFQWGWGRSLFGVDESVPIVSFLPMMLFAILFGLSMDYEVFLLSRIREEYLARRDNDSAVIEGISATARVITSAALIMISVFAAFALSDDPTIKMFGLGLATAVLVDATIVRVVLVPATMRLLGDWNWWLPGWLDRRLPRFDLEGEAALAGLDADADADSDEDRREPVLVG